MEQKRLERRRLGSAKRAPGSAAVPAWVATGKGDGSSIYNAGCFYTLAGEGHEESITLKEGKTYVLTYKVFRPAGVDAYTYIDINEGQGRHRRGVGKRRVGDCHPALRSARRRD